MRIKKIENKIATKIIAIVTTLLFFLITALTCLTLMISDKYINPSQGLPEIENGTLDFSACDIGNKYLKQHMSGEYEFFYNHWIVEENYSGEPDAKVNVPHRFKGSAINGKVLDNSGYASYRLIVTGIPVGTPISFSNNNFIGAFYGYVNNKLIYTYGTRQKSGECASKGGYDFSEEFIVDSIEPLEIVFEVSSSKQGGLTAPPRLVMEFKDNVPSSPSFTNSIGLFVLGITLSLFIFSFLINFENGKGLRNLSFIFVMVAMLCLTVFSVPVFWRILAFIPLNIYNIIMDVNYFATFALLASLFFYFIQSNLIKNYKSWLIFLSISAVVSIILYFALMGTFYQIIAVILQIVCFIPLVYPLTVDFMNGKKINILYVFLLLGIFIYLLYSSFDMLNIIIGGLEKAIAYLIMAINLFIIILYRRISVENSKKLIYALQTEKDHNAIKAEALKSQIKPHFVFNSLTNIQAAYKKDATLGDRAITMFSRHLRANINSSLHETVPFSIELENIMNYIELENLRRAKDVNVLLDCNDTDFKVPILSLQPFIENAFKYSHVEDIENGFIEIITSETPTSFIVEVNDNGVGFDIKSISKTSVGLKNARERLRLISSATVLIDSNIGVGTKIKIIFPKK